MNLPTAHNYVLQNLIDNLISLEANFLKPNILIQLLKKTELALAEVIETFFKPASLVNSVLDIKEK